MPNDIRNDLIIYGTQQYVDQFVGEFVSAPVPRKPIAPEILPLRAEAAGFALLMTSIHHSYRK
jgi:hypothetical protein